VPEAQTAAKVAARAHRDEADPRRAAADLRRNEASPWLAAADPRRATINPRLAAAGTRRVSARVFRRPPVLSPKDAVGDLAQRSVAADGNDQVVTLSDAPLRQLDSVSLARRVHNVNVTEPALDRGQDAGKVATGACRSARWVDDEERAHHVHNLSEKRRFVHQHGGS
jgi:hypothetical protein